MAAMRSPKKKVFEDPDILKLEELLNTLSEADLLKLEEELIDPDDTHIPPNQRCKYRTEKKDTGPFNRKALLDFLEKKAREDPDWEEVKPFVKEIRGKIWKPKPPEKLNIDDSTDTEWDQVLNNASEEELVDLAAILGFHGMLNQIQYHQAFVENQKLGDSSTGFQGVAKHQDFKTVKDEPPNDTDVNASLEKIQNNDSSLKEVNLNNIKNIPLQKLVKFGEALKTNTHLEKLEMSNTRSTDKVARAIIESLKSNKTLKVLSMESNYISGESIVKLLEAINENMGVTEFRIANQRPQVLGNQVEMRITEAMEENSSLVRFSLHLQGSDPRVRVQEYLQRNYDATRRQRIGELTGPLVLPKKEKKVYVSRRHKVAYEDGEGEEGSGKEDSEEEE